MINFKLINNRYIIFFILIIAFYLRLYRLGYHDLWYDEVGTVNYAEYPWGNWNAPLYWILLHYWIKIFGISEFSLRFPSLIFNFLSVILVFFLGKRLFNEKVGIVASFFIALSSLHLWYAQEARDYSMMLFFGTLSSYLLFRALEEGSLKLWLFFIFVSMIGFYTNYFYFFLFFAQGIYLIFSKKLKFNYKEIIYFLIIIFSFIPYLPRFLNKFNFVRHGFWVPKPTWHSFFITLENFVLGYNGFFSLYLISDVLVCIFLIFAFWSMHRNNLKQNFLFCISLFFIPIFCIFLFSKVFFPIYLDRALIVFSPYFYLILSLGLTSINKKWLSSISIVIFFSLFCFGAYAYHNDLIFYPYSHHEGAFLKKPFKPIVRFIESNIKEGDIIAVTNINPPIIPSLSFYSQKIKNFYFFFDPKFNDPNWQRPLSRSLFNIPIYEIDKLNFIRLWLISTDGGARMGGLDENSQSVKDWCGKNLKLELAREFDGVWIFIYSRG